MDGGSFPDLSPHAAGTLTHPRTAPNHEGLRRRRGAAWGGLRALCRRDPRSRWRERRGEKHADEDHRRRAYGVLGPFRARWTGYPVSIGSRRAFRRHRDGSSGTQRGARSVGGRERVSRRPADQPLRAGAVAAHGPRSGRATQEVRHRRRSDVAARRPSDRPPATDRDRPRIVLRRPHHHSRRANVSPLAAGGRTAVHDVATITGRRHRHRVHFPFHRGHSAGFGHGDRFPQRKEGRRDGSGRDQQIGPDRSDDRQGRARRSKRPTLTISRCRRRPIGR